MCKYDLCGVKFREESELKDHIKGHHRSKLEPPVEEGNDKHEIVVGDTEVKDDSSTQQINSAIDSSDAKDDASTGVSGTYNDKHVEEVGKVNQSEGKNPVEPNIPNSEIGEKDDTEAQDDETDKLEEEKPL